MVSAFRVLDDFENLAGLCISARNQDMLNGEQGQIFLSTVRMDFVEDVGLWNECEKSLESNSLFKLMLYIINDIAQNTNVGKKRFIRFPFFCHRGG